MLKQISEELKPLNLITIFLTFQNRLINKGLIPSYLILELFNKVNIDQFISFTINITI
jgi:hypothetical protein